MLAWPRGQLLLAQAIGALLFAVLFIAPLAIILAASLARQWNGVLPTGLTFEHFGDVWSGANRAAAWASLATGLVASLVALVSGAWAALALRGRADRWTGLLGLLFFIPSAVPSVSVGLGLLVAFSQKPLLLNGTTAIVVVAHFVLISAFAFGNITAGLARISPDFEEVASCLGADPVYRLRRVTLPLLAPHLAAAFGLGFALSMGELGATAMVYPPALTTLLIVVTLGMLAITDRALSAER